MEYIARLVEEEELEDDDKKEGVRGMLEGFLPVSSIPQRVRISISSGSHLNT